MSAMAIERQDGSRSLVPNLCAVMHQSISADVPVLCGAKYTVSRNTCKEANPRLDAGSAVDSACKLCERGASPPRFLQVAGTWIGVYLP